MKRLVAIILSFVLVFALLPASAHAAGGVSINKTNFPDANFRSYVKKFDTNGNGYLNSSELAAVTEIDCSSMGIKSLKGVEYFTNLDTLKCYNNQLSALDVSANTKLWHLECAYNEISKLDVSKNKQLSGLYCDGNKLTSLNVSANTELYQLSCIENQISKLDVSKNKKLGDLYCSNNKLTSLNVSANTALEALCCDNNQIKKFNVSRNTNLQVFFCGGNDLTELDVSKNTELVSLDCSSNKLTSLDVTKNTELKELYCNGNQLTKLDVSRNTKLEKLFCEKNNIASLNIKNCPNILKDFQKGVQRKQDDGYLYSTEFKLISSGGGVELYKIPHGLSVDKATKVSPTAKPGVKTQPWDAKVREHDRAKFAVEATGGGQSYQWYYHTATDKTWKKVSINGTSNTYYLDTKARHNGNVYRCKITNASGSIYTKAVTLTVVAPPAVTTQPKDVVAAVGDTVTFSVKASGEQLTYQWYYLNATTDGWKKVSINGTSETYTLTVKERHNGNRYYCDVTDMFGNNVFSNEVTLRVVKAAPKITSQPVDANVNAGEAAVFICSAEEGISFQWWYQKPGETTWNKVSINGTSNVYKLAEAMARHNGYKYRCEVSNPLGSVYSNVVTLTVNK